jgi:hypothetical protein
MIVAQHGKSGEAATAVQTTARTAAQDMRFFATLA